MAWTVSATSCVRMICTPPTTARVAHASDAGKRSFTSAPSNFPMNDLRETPSSSGRSNFVKRSQIREQLQILFQCLAKTDAGIEQ